MSVSVWIPTIFSLVMLASLAGVPESDALVVANGAAVIVQGIAYFMFGKLTSHWVNRWRTERK